MSSTDPQHGSASAPLFLPSHSCGCSLGISLETRYSRSPLPQMFSCGFHSSTTNLEVLALARLLLHDGAIWAFAFGASSCKAGAVSYSCSGIPMNVKCVAQEQSSGSVQRSPAGLSSGSRVYVHVHVLWFASFRPRKTSLKALLTEQPFPVSVPG